MKKENGRAYLSVDWHPTKDLLVTGSDAIRLFDTSGHLLKTVKHRPEETLLLTVKWHPGGRFFASGDYGHKEEGIESLLQFWNEDGTPIKSIRGSKGEYRTLRWNNKGNRLATASDALRLWTEDGQLVHSGQSEDPLWGLDWNPQGHQLITGSRKGTVRLWNSKAEGIAAF